MDVASGWSSIAPALLDLTRDEVPALFFCGHAHASPSLADRAPATAWPHRPERRGLTFGWLRRGSRLGGHGSAKRPFRFVLLRARGPSTSFVLPYGTRRRELLADPVIAPMDLRLPTWDDQQTRSRITGLNSAPGPRYPEETPLSKLTRPAPPARTGSQWQRSDQRHGGAA